MKIRELATADEIIDALGGTFAAAKTLGKTAQSISNCRLRGKLPSDTFLIATDALKKIKCTASPSLWGIAASLEAVE